MPKLSKSKRNKLKAEAERKAPSTKSKTYSNHKERICYHYKIGYGLCAQYDIFGNENNIWNVKELKDPPWIITEFVGSRVVNPYIEVIASGEYICKKCGHKFTKEEYETLHEFLENKKYAEYDLPNGFEPVHYCYVAPNKIVWTSRTEKSRKL